MISLSPPEGVDVDTIPFDTIFRNNGEIRRINYRFALGTEDEPYANPTALKRGLDEDYDRYVADPDVRPSTKASYEALNAKRLMPGDNILLMPGEYKNPSYDEHVDFLKNVRVPTEDNKLPDDTLAMFFTSEGTLDMEDIIGEDGAPITLMPQTPNTVVIKTTGRQAIDVKGCAWVVIKDLEFVGSVDSISYDLAFSQQFLYRYKPGYE